MIIKSLAVRNIRSYTSASVKFPKGSVLLAGDIGSGKSSILQSIEFALFGARRDSISGDALLRKSANEGEVILSVEINGKEITITRKLKRVKNSVLQDSGSITINGTKLEGTATELKARVLDIIGYPKELITKSKSLIYRYTVYTPQEEMKHIIADQDGQRLDTLRKVFGIDKYKRIAQNTSLYLRKIRERKREISGIIQGIDEKRRELKIRMEELSKSEKTRKSLVAPFEETKLKVESIKKEIKALESKTRLLNELKNKSDVFDARITHIIKQRKSNSTETETINSQINQIKEKLETVFLEEKTFPPAEDIEKDITVLERKRSEFLERKTQLTERRSHILTRIDKLKQDIDTKKESSSLAEEKEESYAKLLEKLKDKQIITQAIKDITMELNDSEKKIAEIRVKRKGSEDLKNKVAALDTCPTCLQKVSSAHKKTISNTEDEKIDDLELELSEITDKKDKIRQLLDTNNEKLEDLLEKERKSIAAKVEIENLKSIRKEIGSLKESHASLDKEKIEIITQIEKLDDIMIDKLESDLKNKKELLKEINKHELFLKDKKHNLVLLADRQKRKESLEKDQEELKQEVSLINIERIKINEESKKLLPVKKTFDDKKSELEEVLLEEKRLEVRLGEAGKEIQGIKNFIIMLEKDVTFKEKAEKELNDLEGRHEWLEKMFINLMDTMERQIMARVHSEFSELFSTWFNLLIEDDNISVRIDDTFSPIVSQNDYETTIDHLSGGEKTSVALAYRLALNRVINDMISGIKTRDILILDEPTDGFSSEQLDKVRDVLDELKVEQTIIVSHESKIESFVDHVIKVHKNDHVSRINTES